MLYTEQKICTARTIDLFTFLLMYHISLKLPEIVSQTQVLVEVHVTCGTVGFLFCGIIFPDYIIYNDLESGLKLVPKLTSDHVNLTPYSVMRVRLAAQVLSESVGSVLNAFGPVEVERDC